MHVSALLKHLQETPVDVLPVSGCQLDLLRGGVLEGWYIQKGFLQAGEGRLALHEARLTLW